MLYSRILSLILPDGGDGNGKRKRETGDEDTPSEAPQGQEEAGVGSMNKAVENGVEEGSGKSYRIGVSV